MLRSSLFGLLLVVWVQVSLAQSTTEIGVTLGASYYLGDLNPTTQFPSKSTHLGWGIMLRQPLNDRWAWKTHYYRGKLSAADANSSSEIQRNRNLSFETDLTELSTQFEFNFFKYHSFVINQNFTPYLYGGLAFFWINPKAELNGNLYELRSYQTEIREKLYPRMQFGIPFGLGFKFKFSHRFMFSLEYGFRRTFTDYIDDVSTSYPSNPDEINTVSQELSNRSINIENRQNEWGTQRGNSQRNDFYTVSQFTLLIRLGKNPNLCRYNTQ